MPRGLPDANNSLWVEGQAISLDFTRTSPTSGRLAWTLPVNAKVYDGIVITGSIKETNPSNYPTDGVRYSASSDFAVPSNMIGNAQVAVAIYGDTTTVTTDVTNLMADVPYFFTAHVVSAVNTYYTSGTNSYPSSLTVSAYAGDVQKSFGPPTTPILGQVYFDEDLKLMFMWDGSVWTPTKADNVFSGPTNPVPPFVGYPDGYGRIGDFFYNTIEHSLKLWTGATWVNVESDGGVPTYAKQGVGTDLTYSARANLIDILKKQLGYPVVCVELIEDHFNIAINNALQELRRRTDIAYYKQYFFVGTKKFQEIYYLNDPVKGTDRIVDIVKVHRLNMLGLSTFTPDNLYAQQFMTQFYSPGSGFDMVSIHLMHSMSELYSQVFAGDIAFNWRESSREMRIYRQLGHDEKVLLETSCEKTEQELLVDRWVQQWIQAWAESEAMLILSHIRGKFASLPGPGGGIQLNSDSLISQANAIQEDCLRQIRDFEVGQNGSDNFFLPFVIG